MAWRVDKEVYQKLRQKFGKQLAKVLRSMMKQLTGE